MKLLGKTDMSFESLINSTRGSPKGHGDPYGKFSSEMQQGKSTIEHNLPFLLSSK